MSRGTLASPATGQRVVVSVTHVGDLFVGQHLIDAHERVLGRGEAPQQRVLAPPTLLVRDFLHCNTTCFLLKKSLLRRRLVCYTYK